MLAVSVGCVECRSERDETQRQEEQQHICPKWVRTYAAIYWRAFLDTLLDSKSGESLPQDGFEVLQQALSCGRPLGIGGAMGKDGRAAYAMALEKVVSELVGPGLS
jgi:hypothetical protein